MNSSLASGTLPKTPEKQHPKNHMSSNSTPMNSTLLPSVPFSTFGHQNHPANNTPKYLLKACGRVIVFRVKPYRISGSCGTQPRAHPTTDEAKRLSWQAGSASLRSRSLPLCRVTQCDDVLVRGNKVRKTNIRKHCWKVRNKMVGWNGSSIIIW